MNFLRLCISTSRKFQAEPLAQQRSLQLQLFHRPSLIATHLRNSTVHTYTEKIKKLQAVCDERRYKAVYRAHIEEARGLQIILRDAAESRFRFHSGWCLLSWGVHRLLNSESFEREFRIYDFIKRYDYFRLLYEVPGGRDPVPKSEKRNYRKNTHRHATWLSIARDTSARIAQIASLRPPMAEATARIHTYRKSQRL